MEEKVKSGSGGQTPRKLHRIIDDKLFRFVRYGIVKNDDTQIFVTCLLCNTGKKIVGDTKSTGNFLKHLQKAHPTEHKNYQHDKRIFPENNDESQPKVKAFCSAVSVTSGLEVQLSHFITDYVVNSMKPLSTVDDPYFRTLLRRVARNSKLPILNQKSLGVQISTKYKETVDRITAKMKPLDYICLTADCWSSHSRAFLGVTGHWIKEDFTRESVVLACTRFKGTHSYDRIAEQLNHVMAKYGIKREQVVAVVTDNGSNFCKAFREFGIEFGVEKSDSVVQESELDEESLCYELDSDEDEIQNQDLDEMLRDGKSNSPCQLPPHFRCTSHTLSLVATKDGLNVKDKRLYHVALGKCTKLWNLSSSPKSSEIIKNVCGISLKRPAPTRWNSLYDSLQCLLRVEEHFDKICEELSLPSFQPKEIELLKEYVEISKPVAIALDKLQGEFGMFMGALLPTLVRVKTMLNNLKRSTQHCKAFLEAHIEGIDTRFGDLLRIDPANPSDFVLASLSNPLFKFRFLPQNLHGDLKKQFILKAATYANLPSNKSVLPLQDFDPFYDFEDEEMTNGSDTSPLSINANCVELECVRYFNDNNKQFSMLNQYPTILLMFRRYNTCLPSSAPVERVFSYAGLCYSNVIMFLFESKTFCTVCHSTIIRIELIGF